VHVFHWLVVIPIDEPINALPRKCWIGLVVRPSDTYSMRGASI
jgi:hypothetical protein